MKEILVSKDKLQWVRNSESQKVACGYQGAWSSSRCDETSAFQELFSSVYPTEDFAAPNTEVIVDPEHFMVMRTPVEITSLPPQVLVTESDVKWVRTGETPRSHVCYAGSGCVSEPQDSKPNAFKNLFTANDKVIEYLFKPLPGHPRLQIDELNYTVTAIWS